MDADDALLQGLAKAVEDDGPLLTKLVEEEDGTVQGRGLRSLGLAALATCGGMDMKTPSALITFTLVACVVGLAVDLVTILRWIAEALG